MLAFGQYCLGKIANNKHLMMKITSVQEERKKVLPDLKSSNYLNEYFGSNFLDFNKRFLNVSNVKNVVETTLLYNKLKEKFMKGNCIFSLYLL